MGAKNRTFRNEFRLKNFGFNFLYVGESKHVFIQSQVSVNNGLVLNFIKNIFGCR